MVQRLHRQRRRLVRVLPALPGLGDAAAHLHQAVEATAVLPRAAPAVGVEADVDQPRRQLPPALGAEAEVFQRVGTVAVHEDVGVLQQVFKHHAICRLLQIQPRAAFAKGHVRDNARFVPGRRIDAQHIGAETGKETAGSGAGKHAGQVQHLEAGQRPRCRALPGVGVFILRIEEMHQRFGIHCQPLRMLLPLRPTAHFGGAAVGVDDCLFQIGTAPLGDVRCHGGTVGAGAQYAFGGGAVMRGVGVQADPAVLGCVVTGHRIPQRRNVPAHRTQRSGEPERGQTSIDFHRGQVPGLLPEQFADGLPGSADAGAGQVGHGERRGQGAMARERNRRVGQAECGLNGRE